MSLKFKETNFDEYLISANKNQLHPKLNAIYKNIKKKTLILMKYLI